MTKKNFETLGPTVRLVGPKGVLVATWAESMSRLRPIVLRARLRRLGRVVVEVLDEMLGV